MPTSTRVLSFAAPLVFLAVAAVVACSDGPTFVVGPAATDASLLDADTTPGPFPPDDDAGPRDAGFDPTAPARVCAALAATIPAGAFAQPEIFDPNGATIGCPGKIRYDAAIIATACGAGWSACNAAQLKGNRYFNGGNYHYWLESRLWASPNGDTGRCYAAPALGTPAPGNCGNNATGSMHICSNRRLIAGQDRYNVPDDLGNTCGQVNCDFDPTSFTSSTPVPNNVATSGAFGGCGNDETAGVLCCRN